MGAGVCKWLGGLQTFATPLQVLRRCLVNPLSPACAYMSEQWMYLALVGLVGITRRLPGLEMTCTALAQGLQIP